MPKYLKWTKTALYILAGILIFIFYKSVMSSGLAFLVGGVILVYALEEMAFRIVRRQYAELAESVIQFVLAVLMFLSYNDLTKICLIWGVWAIIREGREMIEALVSIRERRLALVDIVESIVVIVLSAMMILEPGEHHATVHLILLGIELILEVTFPLLEELVKPKKAGKTE